MFAKVTFHIPLVTSNLFPILPETLVGKIRDEQHPGRIIIPHGKKQKGKPSPKGKRNK